MFSERLSYAFTDPGAIGFLQGLAEATEEKGYELLLLPGMRGDAQHAAAVRDAVVGGFCLYCMPDGHPAIAAAYERRLPVVIADEPRSEGAFFVGIDDRGACRALAEHVAGLGHEHLAVVADHLIDDSYEGFAGPERVTASTFRVSRERVAGFTAGAPSGTPLPVYETIANVDSLADRAVGALMDLDPRPTALMCATDVLALGAIAALRERGLDVPGDVSVTGFDDIPAAAPADLTTMRQSLQRKGQEAGRLLLEPDTEREVILPVELVERGSTAPPA
jgi:DNA-binding LacI/PurR family transcriptional regulator